MSDPTPVPVSPDADLRRRAAEQSKHGNYWAGKVLALLDRIKELEATARPARPLAYGAFERRGTPDVGPEYVMVRVYEGQENLHIDGVYALYRRTDGPPSDPHRCPAVSARYGWRCTLHAGHDGGYHVYGDYGFRDTGARIPGDEVVHACPRSGEAVTSCCGRTPFELPATDRMTLDHAHVTCGAAAPAGDPETEGAHGG